MIKIVELEVGTGTIFAEIGVDVYVVSEAIGVNVGGRHGHGVR